MPVGFQRACSYVQETEAIREKFPGVVIVPGIEALGEYLKCHTWNQRDVLASFPWREKLFRKTAGQTLPFILNTDQVRRHYPKIFET